MLDANVVLASLLSRHDDSATVKVMEDNRVSDRLVFFCFLQGLVDR